MIVSQSWSGIPCWGPLVQLHGRNSPALVTIWSVHVMCVHTPSQQGFSHSEPFIRHTERCYQWQCLEIHTHCFIIITSELKISENYGGFNENNKFKILNPRHWASKLTSLKIFPYVCFTVNPHLSTFFRQTIHEAVPVCVRVQRSVQLVVCTLGICRAPPEWCHHHPRLSWPNIWESSPVPPGRTAEEASRRQESWRQLCNCVEFPRHFSSKLTQENLTDRKQTFC